MSRMLAFTLVAACLFVPPRAAQADPVTILAPGSVWNYTFTDPTGDPSWNTITGIGGLWQSGVAPFSNCPDAGCGGFTTDFDRGTLWPADTNPAFEDDLWVRTSVTLPAVRNLQWHLGADNGFKLYLNGVQIGGDDAEGYTFRWEYSGGIPQSLLRPGDQVVAVALDDRGGLTAFDMEIVGDPVPEPGTLLLVGTGALAAARAIKRRRKTADASAPAR